MLDRYKKFNDRLSIWMEWVGLVAIMLMILITCVDVIGAKIFLRPVFGAIDIVMLAQLIAIAFAACATLLMGRHVQVEFFVMMLPQKLQAIVDAFIQLLGLGLFAVMAWQLFVYAHLLQITGEVSSTARIPLHFFAYAVALSMIPVCLILLRYFLKSIGLVVKK
jgi:TRAP-type C4-dicarboxylate transport system permease small subunit